MKGKVYAHLPNSPGIYLMKHRTTGDTYVGSASNIRARFVCHTNGSSRSRRISAVVRDHGWDFDCSVLELTGDAERFPRERHWIDTLKPTLNASAPPKTGRMAPVTVDNRIRVPIRMDDTTKRMLQFMAIDRGMRHMELASELLAAEIDRRWAALAS